jgi:putative endonuclease
MASRKEGALYIGVTSDLIKRVWEHKEAFVEGHTKKYNIKHLVYFETYENAEAAILREKRIKVWKREWKIELIEKTNPDWKDLYEEVIA